MEELSKEQQFEALFNGDFSAISEVSDETLDRCFTISIAEVVAYLQVRQLEHSWSFEESGNQDGLWITNNGHGYELIDRVRGHVHARRSFDSFDELLRCLALILLNKIPRHTRSGHWDEWKI